MYDLPNNNVGEITVIGTGGGYGESCVIHLGDQVWAVVDSCTIPGIKDFSLPLEYLKKIGVNVSTQVKYIICTHWDDDHILGISTLLLECNSAKFYISDCTDKKKFLQLVSLDYKKIEREASNSSTLEFGKSLEILFNERRSHPNFANQDKLICLNNLGTTTSEIFALSPCDFTKLKFATEISTLMDSYQLDPSTKISFKSQNEKAVALFLKLGPHKAILGADLEVSKDRREGWLDIIDNSISISGKSSLFKVPHHGSENGYHDEIWDKLLEVKPLAKLTPWNRGQKLPTDIMLMKYSGLSSKLYITCPIINLKSKKRDRLTEKLISRLTIKRNLKEVKYNSGLIRSRIDILNSASTWSTDIFDEALLID